MRFEVDRGSDMAVNLRESAIRSVYELRRADFAHLMLFGPGLQTEGRTPKIAGSHRRGLAPLAHRPLCRVVSDPGATRTGLVPPPIRPQRRGQDLCGGAADFRRRHAKTPERERHAAHQSAVAAGHPNERSGTVAMAGSRGRGARQLSAMVAGPRMIAATGCWPPCRGAPFAPGRRRRGINSWRRWLREPATWPTEVPAHIPAKRFPSRSPAWGFPGHPGPCPTPCAP